MGLDLSVYLIRGLPYEDVVDKKQETKEVTRYDTWVFRCNILRKFI